MSRACSLQVQELMVHQTQFPPPRAGRNAMRPNEYKARQPALLLPSIPIISSCFEQSLIHDVQDSADVNGAEVVD